MIWEILGVLSLMRIESINLLNIFYFGTFWERLKKRWELLGELGETLVTVGNYWEN
ncbi:hypothetical protein [Anabaena sp. CCY 0017]|uniref:hypothetical protein n=1 Tax=Anabaena sp. CCY 0017 TaxID=3103866 RepID=UPI0039C67BB8